MRFRKAASSASSARRSAETAPRTLTGSAPQDSHSSGSSASNRSRVSGCQDQRRLVTNCDSGRSSSGRDARTVSLRRACTRVTLAAGGPGHSAEATVPRTTAGAPRPRRRGPPATGRPHHRSDRLDTSPAACPGGRHDADVCATGDVDSVAAMTGRPDLRLGITDVAPVVSCGSFSTRAVVGEHLPITATVFREGHDAVAANVVFTPPAEPGAATATPPLLRMTKFGPEPDRWTATVVPDREGLWTYQVEAWDDPLSTWHHDVEVKVEAGQGAEELANDLESGARLLEEVATSAPEEHREALLGAAAALRDKSHPLTARIAPALSPA